MAATYSFHGNCATKKMLMSCDQKKTYDQVAKQLKTKPALFLVWADWCGYCKESMPHWLEFQTLFLSDKVLAKKVVVFDVEAKLKDLLISGTSPKKISRSSASYNAFPQVFYLAPGDSATHAPEEVPGETHHDPKALITFLKGKLDVITVKKGGARRAHRKLRAPPKQ